MGLRIPIPEASSSAPASTLTIDNCRTGMSVMCQSVGTYVGGSVRSVRVQSSTALYHIEAETRRLRRRHARPAAVKLQTVFENRTVTGRTMSATMAENLFHRSSVCERCSCHGIRCGWQNVGGTPNVRWKRCGHASGVEIFVSSW